jgi:hypothetical protein
MGASESFENVVEGSYRTLSSRTSYALVKV